MSSADKKQVLIFTLLTAVLLAAAAALSLWRTGEEAVPAASPAAVPASAGNWGLSFPTEGEAPVGNASQADLANYDAYYLGDTGQKVIYLTFDCGYENGYTEKILDALKKHTAPAAFFVVGNMIETAPEIIRRMAEEGHIVGNHTFHHPDMSAISDQAAFQKELDSLAALYQETTGKELPRFYRPRRWAIGPCSGAWPTWIGIRITSRRQSRPTGNFCPEFTTGRLCYCTPRRRRTRIFWMNC